MKKHFLSIVIAIALVIGLIPVISVTAYDVSKSEINGETYYEISTAEDLIWFAQLVNGTNETANQNTSANAILLNDIVLNKNVLNGEGLLNDGEFTQWIPIGNYNSPYKGTFDGNGKTVKGIYIETDKFSQGLIGVNEGTVKNVTVSDSYICSEGGNIGAVVGYNDGIVENCKNYATTHAYENDYYAEGLGGVVGMLSEGVVQRCVNYGKIMGGYSIYHVGGVVGSMYGGTLLDSYNMGEVSGEDNVGGVVGRITNSAMVYNCYTVGDISCCGDGSGENIVNSYYLSDTETDRFEGTVAKTAEQFASGEVAYLLNGDQSELVFGQIVMGKKKDSFPLFVTAKNKVYQSTGADGTSIVYVNDEEALKFTPEVYTIYFNDGLDSTDLNIHLTNLSCDGTIEKNQDPTTKLWTVKITFPHTEACNETHNFTVICSADCCCVEMVELVDGATYQCRNIPAEITPENQYPDVVAWNDVDNNGEISEGETTYTSLSSALKAGGVAKMYRSYDVGNEGRITVDTLAVTLDLNGKRLTWKEAESSILEIYSGELTIIGDGRITSTMNSDMGPSTAIDVSGGKLIINGGKIESPYYAIEVHDGELIMNGGEISANGLCVQDGSCTINGGTVLELYNNTNNCYINGGVFLNPLSTWNGKFTIKGGSFRYDPSNWVSEGYEAKYDAAENFYNVVPIVYPITFDILENGSVSSNVEGACLGERVTLTAKAMAHYQLEDISVTDQNGNFVSLDENNSFVMPLGGVKVGATFKAIDYATEDELLASVERLNEAIQNGNIDISNEIAIVRAAIANLEKADLDNKTELNAKIESAKSVLEFAVEKVQDNLDSARLELDNAIANGDKELNAKIVALNDALASANAAYEAAKPAIQGELLGKINEAKASLQSAIDDIEKELDSVKKELDNVKKTLESKSSEPDANNNEPQTIIVVIFILSGVSFCGCAALAILYVLDRKRKANK